MNIIHPEIGWASNGSGRAGLPDVSIVTTCRNSERTIRRCVESVLAQTYESFELIIQDGVSIDRTLEIIAEYDDPRIKLVSEPDYGAAEAFVKALFRCKGNFITLCWSDEELLPHCLEWGCRALGDNPSLAAVYSDVYFTDINGAINQDSSPSAAWDLEKFLCWEFLPSYCGSFMRAEALERSGFFQRMKSLFAGGKGNCAESRRNFEESTSVMYDYFAMVGVLYPIQYIPHYVGKFSVHPGQLSSTPRLLCALAPGLFNSINHLCDDPATPATIKNLRQRAYAGVHLSMITSLLQNAHDISSAKEMLAKALQYQPNSDFLARVCADGCIYLLDSQQHEAALDFLNILEVHGAEYPGFALLKATACLESGRIAEAHEAIEKGMMDRSCSQQLQSLKKQLQDHEQWEEAIDTELLSCSDRKKAAFLSQLRSMVSLATPETQRRMGQILNNGMSSESFMTAANILCQTTCRPEFLAAIVAKSIESCSLIEKTLGAFLVISMERAAYELSKKLAATLTQLHVLKNGSLLRNEDLAFDQVPDPTCCKPVTGQKHYPLGFRAT